MDTAIRDDTRESAALLSQLAEQASPRPATSPGEATAAAFVNGRLRRAGMGVATYELRVSPGPGLAYQLYALLGLLAAALTPLFPLPSLLLALNLLVWASLDHFAVAVPPIGRRRASQNIVGTRAVAGAVGLAPVAPRWRVVLMAPLDTPQLRRGLAALASSAWPAALTRLVAALCVACGATTALLFSGPWWLIGLVGAALYLLLLIATLLPVRPAATDGGVAALATLVTVAQRIEQLERVELWTVAVGAASTDPRGVSTLLPRYPFDQAHTLFIAIEELAGPQIAYAIHEGATGPAAGLLRQLAATAAADPLINAAPCAPGRPGCLTAPLRRHGYHTLTICARLTPNATPDLAAPLDPRLVERATRMVLTIVRGLEAER